MPTNHAILSASSSHRWLECPPSAKLCAELPDTSSEYAQEGTDAHALCEHRLKALLGRETTDPTENLTYYNEEMERCAVEYATYAYEQVEKAKVACNDPIVLIEQKLDFSKWVPEGFGTGDCVIVADGTLSVIDFKYGKGVEVLAENNPQMKLYALGALELFDGIYDISAVSMTIFQPRRDNISEYAISKEELLRWANEVLAPTAQLAANGNGKSVPSLAAIKTPLRDGDVERPDDPAYANAYFINANSATAPGIVDADCNPVLTRSEVYSGVYGRASINLYAFNSNGNKGIACGLNNLQLIRAGEPLGGKASAESDFATDNDDDFLS